MNSEMIWKIRKKSKLKCLVIWKIWKRRDNMYESVQYGGVGLECKIVFSLIHMYINDVLEYSCPSSIILQANEDYTEK